jgi:hypothetical protein
MQPKLFSYLLLFTLTLSLVACNLVITPPPPSQINPNGVIFTAQQTNASLDAIWPEPTDSWTPSEADVAVQRKIKMQQRLLRQEQQKLPK